MRRRSRGINSAGCGGLAHSSGACVALAIGHLHRSGIVFRDLKPENLMVSFEEGQRPFCKVIDFGFAAKATQQLNVYCGTPAYMSPEIVSKQCYNGLASDMWAAGVLLFTMLFGYQPFQGPTEQDLLRKI